MASSKSANTRRRAAAEPKDHQIHARVTASDVARLERIHVAVGMPASEAIRRGLILLEEQLLGSNEQKRSAKRKGTRR